MFIFIHINMQYIIFVLPPRSSDVIVMDRLTWHRSNKGCGQIFSSSTAVPGSTASWI